MTVPLPAALHFCFTAAHVGDVREGREGTGAQVRVCPLFSPVPSA